MLGGRVDAATLVAAIGAGPPLDDRESQVRYDGYTLHGVDVVGVGRVVLHVIVLKNQRIGGAVRY